MTPFATAADFAIRYGVALTDPETTRANALLDLASDVIRDEAKQKINQVEDDNYTRPGTSDERILLPERPVVSVSSVTLDDLAIDDWYLAGNELVRKGGTIVLSAGNVLAEPQLSRGFGLESQTLAITYTHGYPDEEVPGWLKSLALEIVIRVWVNPSSLIQQNIGNTGTTYAPYAEPPRGLALTETERRKLRRFFGSRGGSVWVSGT